MPPRHSPQTDELGEVLDVLSHPHRREVLTRLHARTPREEGGPKLAELTDDRLGDETINLVHNHLPKLADAGFINWDRKRHVVTRGPRFDQLAPVLDLIIAHEDELPANWP